MEIIDNLDIKRFSVDFYKTENNYALKDWQNNSLLLQRSLFLQVSFLFLSWSSATMLENISSNSIRIFDTCKANVNKNDINLHVDESMGMRTNNLQRQN